MAKKKLGIVDFEKKGNVVRFYIGDTTADYWGDDWDDTPYEHNAGRVYDRFVDHYIDIAFPYDCDVLEPQDDWHYRDNSPFCKEDFKLRKVPCVVVVRNNPDEWNDNHFSQCCASEDAIKFYYGDIIDELGDDTLNIIHHITQSFNV